MDVHKKSNAHPNKLGAYKYAQRQAGRGTITGQGA